MKLRILFVVLSLTISSLCRADVSPEKRGEIEKMLKITGMEKLMDQMMKQLIDSLRVNMKEVPDEFWERFSKKLKPTEMIEMIIPLYDKYYSLDDLKAVNAFYSSPAGQRVLSTLPQIMQESMAIGQKWGEKVAQEAAEEALAEMKQKREKPE